MRGGIALRFGESSFGAMGQYCGGAARRGRVTNALLDRCAEMSRLSRLVRMNGSAADGFDRRKADRETTVRNEFTADN
jgi:hypothetical protein